jgi:NosR/NirI family nitrous oxide reductase transcriptional regulator
MGIDLDAVNLVRSGECINCLNCTSICPKNNAKLVINDKALNEYAVATLAVAGTTGLYLGVDQLASNYTDTNTGTIETTTSKYADGTYTGSGRGYSGTTKVSVVISNGKITSINLISENDSQKQFQSAWNSIPNKIISSNSTDVNVVSGATYSSEGIIAAVEDALTQAEAAKNGNTTLTSTSTSTSSVSTTTTTRTTTSTSNSTATTKYKDGTYTGSGRGYSGTTQVSVVISNDKITSVTLISENDSPRQFQSAWNSVPNEIISSNSTDVNTVSGATYSSEGIIAAVNDALAQAEY